MDHVRVRWIVRGDIDGFFGLALDNLVQLLLIDTLCRGVLGFPPELLYGRVLPGAAISILVGNVAYAFQAQRARRAHGTHRRLRAARTASTRCRSSPTCSWSCCRRRRWPNAAGAADPARVAWQAGLLRDVRDRRDRARRARFVAERVRKATPRAALLSTLAGIALGFISLGFLFRTFAHPVVGLTTLAIVMLTYFGRVRFKGHLPGGVVAVALGTLLCWITGIAPVGARPSAAALHLPVPVVGDLMAAIGGGHLLPYLSVIIAMGLFNVLGSLQNIESAEAAGDCLRHQVLADDQRRRQRRGRALRIGVPDDDLHRASRVEGDGRARRLFDPERRVRDDDLRHRHAGLDRVGDPDRRRHGDRPLDRHDDRRAGVPGHAARARARRRRRPAARHRRVGRAAWRRTGCAPPASAGRRGRSAKRSIGEFQKTDTWIAGAFAIEQGFLFTAMLLSAAVVGVIERRWRRAAAWCGVRRAALGLRADALLPVDVRRHGAEARAGMAVRDWLRRHVAALSQRTVDDRRGRRRKLTRDAFRDYEANTAWS